MMRLLFTLAVLTFTWFTAAQAQVAGEPCLSSYAHYRLKEMHPDGVPGKLPAAAKTEHNENPTFEYLIPVVVHVMHDYGSELAVDMARVDGQIQALNENFGMYGIGDSTSPSAAAAHIRFCRATKDPMGNDTNGITYHTFAPSGYFDIDLHEEAMKQISQWDPERYLNIWVVRNIVTGNAVAYSYFPDQAAGTWWDGVVVEHDFFGSKYQSSIARTEGDVVAHEVGHYLSLDHPWGREQTNDCTSSDGCDDTPQVNNPCYANTTTSCRCFQECGNDRQEENLMDYTDDACRNLFTACQVAKMRDALIQYRGTLISAENAANTGCAEELDSLENIEGFYIYPNPATTSIIINCGDKDPGTVKIYDVKGQLVFETEVQTFRGGYTIDLTQLKPASGMLLQVVASTPYKYIRKAIVVIHGQATE